MSSRTCPECGGAQIEGLTCWDQLGHVLAWEATDPELQAAHFLTVASYNLQHPAQFTDAAIAGLRAGFFDQLDNQVSVKELRRRASQLFEGKTRVLRPESERAPTLRRWSMTIADVYIPERPEQAAERVRAWADSVRREMDD